MAGRKPEGFMKYKGDVTDIVESRWNGIGPNYNREIVFPVSAEYDPETNTTRVGFTKTPPEEMFPKEG